MLVKTKSEKTKFVGDPRHLGSPVQPFTNADGQENREHQVESPQTSASFHSHNFNEFDFMTRKELRMRDFHDNWGLGLEQDILSEERESWKLKNEFNI